MVSAIAQIAAKNNIHSLFLSCKAPIISLLQSSSLVIIRLIAYPTPIMNFFSSKLYIFSTVIRYFSIAAINYNFINTHHF